MRAFSAYPWQVTGAAFFQEAQLFEGLASYPGLREWGKAREVRLLERLSLRRGPTGELEWDTRWTFNQYNQLWLQRLTYALASARAKGFKRAVRPKPTRHAASSPHRLTQVREPGSTSEPVR